MSLAQKFTPRIVTHLLDVLSADQHRVSSSSQLMLACLTEFSYTLLTEAAELILHLHELAPIPDFALVAKKLLFCFSDMHVEFFHTYPCDECLERRIASFGQPNFHLVQSSIVSWLKHHFFISRPSALSDSTLPLLLRVFARIPQVADFGDVNDPLVIHALARSTFDFHRSQNLPIREANIAIRLSFRSFSPASISNSDATTLVQRAFGAPTIEEIGPFMIHRLIQLRRSQELPAVDFYDMLFKIFRFCPFAPLVEAVELILHIDESEQQFQRVAQKYSFCFHCVSPEHNHTRPCPMCVKRRQNIFRSANIEFVILSFVEWMMQRYHAASTFVRSQSTVWVLRKVCQRLFLERQNLSLSLLRSIDQLCNAPAVVEMHAMNNSLSLQAAASSSQTATVSDSQSTSKSTSAESSSHGSARVTPPKDSSSSTLVSATPTTKFQWRSDNQPVNLDLIGAFGQTQGQGQPEQHQSHNQQTFHLEVSQRLQVVASAQSTDVVCTQCGRKCTYPRTKAQAGDDVCVCSDAGFALAPVDTDVAAVAADVTTVPLQQLAASAAPTEPITDLPEWKVFMQSEIEKVNKSHSAQIESLKTDHSAEIEALKNQLAPLSCSDFVVKLADLLQSVLRHSLKKHNVDVASHQSVLQQQYSKKLKMLPDVDQALCDYLRVISRPRNSLAHPCELASQNAEFQLAVPPRSKPLGQHLSWSSLIRQLRGAMHGKELDNLFAEVAQLNRDDPVSRLDSLSGSQIACNALLMVLAFVENPKSQYLIQSEPISGEDRQFIQSFRVSSSSSSK